MTICLGVTTQAQGKYAGSMKGLLNKTYTDIRNFPPLKSWTFVQGSLLTPVDDPESIIAHVFKKGTTWIVVVGLMEDTSATKYTVVELLEIKNIAKPRIVRIASCKEGENENLEIIGLIKPASKEYEPVIKAWRFNRDKRRIEIKSIRNTSCLNERFDNT
jgi:hypothetical protein